MILELEETEINGILSVLGQLPTSSDAWPLVQKIKYQFEQHSTENKSDPEPVKQVMHEMLGTDR